MTTTDLVPVFTGTLAGQSTPLCNARDLHAALGVGRDFATWIKERIAEYGFVAGEDFIFGSPKRGNQTGRGGDRRSRDYHLTLDMAKELAMIENNEIGRSIRRYLIALEKKQQSAPVALSAPDPITPNLRDRIAKKAHALSLGLTPADIPDYASRVAAQQRPGVKARVERRQAAQSVCHAAFLSPWCVQFWAAGREEPQGSPVLHRSVNSRSVALPFDSGLAVQNRNWSTTMTNLPQGAPAPAVESLSVITYQQQPVVTTALLAQLYGTASDNIHDNYRNNADRFVAGKHFIKLEGDALREFKRAQTGPNPVCGIARNVNSLLLWTERGAARHAKMLDTEQAWEVFEKLEDCYFSVKGPAVPAAPALPAPDPITPNLRDRIAKKAHALSLEQYDTLQDLLEELVVSNLRCGATETDCEDYLNRFGSHMGGVTLVNTHDLYQLSRTTTNLLDEAGKALAVIHRLEKHTGMELYHRHGVSGLPDSLCKTVFEALKDR